MINMPKTDFRKPLGSFGEKLACQFLTAKGYRLVKSNFIIAGGQIDLIMYSPQDNLIFVEVKTRQAARDRPEDCRLSRRQIRALLRAARFFLAENPGLPLSWQLDLIWINLNLYATPPAAKIKHLQNILEK